jgi:radical SAM superfamily enzyme YgiQ (UPF0313 family)
MAKQIMPGKAVPFPIEEWPSVLIQGLTILNRNNWFPAMTLMIGNPGETDLDCMATLDLLCEVERRGLFAFFLPSVFTPLHDTPMGTKQGVIKSRELSPLQWQIMIYRGQPMQIKSRKQLLATVRPQHRKYLRKDNGDLPDGWGSLDQE